MEHYERARIRMECVNLAHRGREGWDEKSIIASADELFRYVMEQTEDAPVNEYAEAQSAQAHDPFAATNHSMSLTTEALLVLDSVDQSLEVRLAQFMLSNAITAMANIR